MRHLARLTTMLLLLVTGLAQAGDAERGRELHQENCIRCHASMQGGIYGADGTGIYVRENRRIDSLEGLYNQVRRCKTSLGVSWPEDQIEDVVTYLNQNFYKFEE